METEAYRNYLMVLNRMRYYEQPYEKVKELIRTWWKAGRISEGDYLRLRLMAWEFCDR